MLTCNFDPSEWSVAGTYITSCTSVGGRSAFFANITQLSTVVGGNATRMSDILTSAVRQLALVCISCFLLCVYLEFRQTKTLLE